MHASDQRLLLCGVRKGASKQLYQTLMKSVQNSSQNWNIQVMSLHHLMTLGIIFTAGITTVNIQECSVQAHATTN